MSDFDDLAAVFFVLAYKHKIGKNYRLFHNIFHKYVAYAHNIVKMLDKENAVYYYVYINEMQIHKSQCICTNGGKRMLTDMGTILRKAKKEGYGVAAPNVWSLNTVKSVFEAASELKAPIIIDGAGVHQIEEISDAVHFYEKKFPEVIAALNLDHGGAFEEIIQAIRSGYTSVMVDRSTLPFEENVKETAEIVKIAHAVGVSVEAELGHVGQGFEYEQTRDSGLTRKEEAIDFVKQTNVDALAVSVGTSHGTYHGIPKLEFELLADLHQMVEVPLVLHGGSGTGDDNLKKAVQTGIQKVNLCTDLSNAGLEKLPAYLQIDYDNIKKDGQLGEFGNQTANMFDLSNEMRMGYKEALKHYITLFGGVNKA